MGKKNRKRKADAKAQQARQRRILARTCPTPAWADAVVYRAEPFPPPADTPNCAMLQCHRCNRHYPAYYVRKHACMDCRQHTRRAIRFLALLPSSKSIIVFAA